MVVVSMDWGPFYKAYENIRHSFYTHSVPQWSWYHGFHV